MRARRSAFGTFLNRRGVVDIFMCIENRHEVERFKNKAEALSAGGREFPVRHFRDIVAVKQYAAAGGLINAANQVQQRRLTATGESRNNQKPAPFNLQADIHQSRHDGFTEMAIARHTIQFYKNFPL